MAFTTTVITLAIIIDTRRNFLNNIKTTFFEFLILLTGSPFGKHWGDTHF
jgi:hypothetical protein